MTRCGIRCLTWLVALLLGLPCGLAAAQPERLPENTFSVTGDAAGNVEVTFVLALSETPNYSVTITAMSGAVEEQLWSGSLPEGLYRLRSTLAKIPASAPVKVVVRTTMVNRTAKGNETFNVYRTWEGTLGR